MIYGKEKTKYILQTDTLIENTIQENTINWVISDKYLDNSDNTTIINNTTLSDTPTKQYESPGIKNVSVNLKFDDGWENIYNHNTSIDVVVEPYDEPVLDFTWTPDDPNITDTVIFSQDNNDIRNDSLNSYYGRIDEIKVDFYNNDIYEKNITKDDDFLFNFSKKENNIPIKLEAKYWDGFEYQSNYIIKYLNMSNVPPVSKWDRTDKGICVPNFEWLATSIDIDDDINDLSYDWELYQDVYGIWNLIDTFNEKLYTYPFQYEGLYKIVLKTTDIEGSFNIKEEEFLIQFKECDGGSTGGTGALKGTLRLQFGGFQLVALPINKKVSDVVDLIALKTNKTDLEVVAVCNAAPGLNTDVGIMYNYVPGVTNKLSTNNFDLIMSDSNIKEITGFWIQMKDHDVLSYIDIEWDSETGEIK